MGVDVSVRAIIGYKVPAEYLEYVSDQYEELYVVNDLSVDFARDLYSGKYGIVGVSLANIDPFYDHGDWYTYPLYDKTFSAEHVASLIRKAFPELIFEATEISLHIYPEYS